VKNKLFVLAIVALAIGIFLFAKYANKKEVVTSSPSDVFLESLSRPHSPSYGNRLGRVTVVEWFDPECESCRMIHPVFKKIISEYQDRVHFVLRYMPFHGNSMYASAALEEAKEYGKYDEALDVLFDAQPEWGDHHQPRPELIPAYLVKLGIPADKLDKAYLLKKHSEKIRMDEADGKAVGVRGTPTFFINGQMLHELGDVPLRGAIEAALKASN
jgi:protein-disulfide isomerase